MQPSAICLRLLEHFIRAAASRTFWTAGRSRPIKTAMMAITTSSSISVNAGRRHFGVRERDDKIPPFLESAETAVAVSRAGGNEPMPILARDGGDGKAKSESS